jgi:hypothetical protein
LLVPPERLEVVCKEHHATRTETRKGLK